MCKFVNLVVDRNNLLSQNTQYLSNVIFLYLRYEKFLNDDYAAKVTYENILNLIENCGDLFFVFLNEEDVSKQIRSQEVSSFVSSVSSIRRST